MFNTTIFAQKLKQFRKLNHLTANEVCQIMNKYNYPISIKTIYKWECGIQLPDIIVLDVLCHVYNIQISQLIDDNNTKQDNINLIEAQFIEMIRNSKKYKSALLLIAKSEIKGVKI